jgi:hypothetical protein
MQTDNSHKERVTGRLLVDKYSPSRGTLYASAGATVYLIEYRGTVALVEDEEGKTFSTQCTEVYFGEGHIVIEQSVPRESNGPAAQKKKVGRRVEIDQTPTLF